MPATLAGGAPRSVSTGPPDADKVKLRAGRIGLSGSSVEAAETAARTRNSQKSVLWYIRSGKTLLNRLSRMSACRDWPRRLEFFWRRLILDSSNIRTHARTHAYARTHAHAHTHAHASAHTTVCYSLPFANGLLLSFSIDLSGGGSVSEVC